MYVFSRLTLSLDEQPALPTVCADEGLVRQVLSVLLTNALNYTPSGGRVQVSISSQRFQDEQWVGFSVADTGPGISQADQVRLFERFFRIKRRDSVEIKGTGLGLAIVKSIVERRHSGRVWVESKLGSGSSFFIVLPIESTQASRE